MDNTENLLEHLKTTLEGILRATPLVSHVQSMVEGAAVGGVEIDLVVNLTLRDGSRHQLIVEFKSQGQPRQLRAAINQILRYRHKSDGDAHPVVAAPYISEEGAAVCREEKVNFCDIAGNCRLVFGGIFIERAGQPNRFPRVVTPDLYAPKGERILRIMLHDRLRSWKVAPLAQAARVSLGTVSTIRTLLLDREWAKETEGGITLTHPDKLLQDWAGVWARRRCEVRHFLSLDGVNTTESNLANAAGKFPDARFAITGLSAAWRHAQWVRYDQVLAYWTGNFDDIAQETKLKPAENGANVHLMVPRDEGVFEEVVGMAGVPVVSAVQAYLDLHREAGRGAEAAEFLWNQVLFPGHATKQ